MVVVLLNDIKIFLGSFGLLFQDSVYIWHHLKLWFFKLFNVVLETKSVSYIEIPSWNIQYIFKSGLMWKEHMTLKNGDN